MGISLSIAGKRIEYQFINPTGWSVYDILDKITLKTVLEVYDKYYKFDNFYISNDKKEFKK